MNTQLVGAMLAAATANFFVSGAAAFAAEDPPREWIEPETGHRVVRLSDEPGSQSLYFHQHPFTADGKKLLFTTPHGISAVDFETREIKEVVAGPVNLIVTGRKTGDAYYMQDGAVHAASIATGKTRLVAKLPEQYRWTFNAGANFRPPGGAAGERRPDGDPAERRGRGDNRPGDPNLERVRRNFGWGNVAINSDETMLVGIGRDPDGQAVPRTPPSGQELGGRLGPRWAAGLPLLMYTIDLATGDTKVIHRSNDWLNHLQCSPTDPEQVLFCHEGPWHLVDRTWLIRTDGSGLKMIHPRTMDMEIEGHEFSAPTAAGCGTTCKRRAAWCSGLPATKSTPAGARGTTSTASTGRCTTISPPTASCFAATAAARRQWPTCRPTSRSSTRRETASGCTCSAPSWSPAPACPSKPSNR
jgi:oligogalacturonide lyase